MRFIDLHSHPVCKTLFNDLSPWEFIKVEDQLLGGIISSQSNLTQITDGNHCNLLCMTLSPVETAMLDQWLLKLAAIFLDALDKDKLKLMIAATGDFCYNKLIEQEKKDLLELPKPPKIPPTKKIKILTKFSEYDPAATDTLFVFFNIEGGYAFYNDGNSEKDFDQILKRFVNFAQKKDYLILYITPSHLSHNIFMTQAYANKIFAKGKLLPSGFGISEEGGIFLDEIVKAGLLIDVKHMSLVSRKQFYKEEKWNKKPLLCSHAGVTGCSWDDKLNKKVVLNKIKEHECFVKIKYNKPKGHIINTYFNPISINLYNEDIVQILKSEGLIGMIMDLRILGGDRNIFGNLKEKEKEFLSPEEFKQWRKETFGIRELNDADYDFPYPSITTRGKPIEIDVPDDEDIEDEFEELNHLTKQELEDFHRKLVFPDNEKVQLFQDRSEEHLLYFVNQLIHIVTVSNSVDPKRDALLQVCIGTDFDGYIRAIDCCKNITNLPAFGKMLAEKMEEYRMQLKLKKPAIEVAQDILYNNVYRFTCRHFLGETANCDPK